MPRDNFRGASICDCAAQVVIAQGDEQSDKEDEVIMLTKCLRLVKRNPAAFIVILLLVETTLLAAQQEPASDAKQLVRTVIDNELDSSHQGQTQWMYQLQRQETDKATVTEVVETKNCDFHLLVALNGEALTPDQRQKENQRLEKLANDPREQQKLRQAQQEDDRKAVEMFKMLPQAFLYRYASRRGPLVELAFSPNPDFRPPSREAQVFHGMEGTMWVDAGKNRLVELDGHLAQDVDFLGGLFGHLEKGGHFTVKRAELAPGQWAMTQLVVEMKGKALIFKSINLRQTDSMSNFRPIPADLNPAQAVEMLETPDKNNEVAGKLASGISSTRAAVR
jgi:hypothetical protein